MGQVRRQEWTWVIVVAGLLVAASTVPYVAGYLAQTPEWRFGGAFMDQVDYHSHLAKMWQGYRGAWSYRLLFTPEPHEGAYLQTFYVSMGHLARVSGLSLLLTYQLARIFLGFLMLLAIYRFTALFVTPVRTRRLAFLLATVASGLGWLTAILVPIPPSGVSPMDFWLLDGYTYLAVLTLPHFSAATTLLLTFYILLLRRSGGPCLAEAGLAVPTSLALGLIHPYALLLADLVPLLYWGIEWSRTRLMNWRGMVIVLALVLTQLPILVYDLWVFRTQPVFAGWSAQNVTLSPPLHIYLGGYGLLLALGIIGVVVWNHWAWPGLAFPLLWIGLVAILAQLPWNLQRRFLEGVQVPLGMLAGVGVAEGLFPISQRQPSGRLRWLAMALLVALTAMSNLYLVVGHTVAAAARTPELFWSADVLAAVDWLGKNTSPEDTVLADFRVGNLIPGRIGHRVMLGHWMETVDYEGKQEAVRRFYSMTISDEERISLLERFGVAYVFYGPQEQTMGVFDPAQVDHLSLVFVDGDVRIYQVIQDRE